MNMKRLAWRRKRGEALCLQSWQAGERCVGVVLVIKVICQSGRADTSNCVWRSNNYREVWDICYQGNHFCFWTLKHLQGRRTKAKEECGDMAKTIIHVSLFWIIRLLKRIFFSCFIQSCLNKDRLVRVIAFFGMTRITICLMSIKFNVR